MSGITRSNSILGFVEVGGGLPENANDGEADKIRKNIRPEPPVSPKTIKKSHCNKGIEFEKSTSVNSNTFEQT